MQISTNESKNIATYLTKGLFKNHYRDMSIDIGKDTQIGALKKGKSYHLYIKYMSRILKPYSAGFYPETETGDIAAMIQELINSCQSISEVELDMSKNPLFSSAKPDESAELNVMEDMDETESNVDVEEADEEQYEVYEGTELEDNSEEQYTDEFAVDDDIYRVTEPVNDLADIIEEETDFKKILPENVTESLNKHVNNANHSAETMDASVMLAATTVTHTKKISPVQEDKSMKDYMINKEPDHIKKELKLLIDKVVDSDNDLALKFYIDSIDTLMIHYKNDVDTFSEETHIPKKSILRVVMEGLMQQMDD